MLTTFVGRRAELDTLRSLVTEHRVVSLLGPPGVGKTRLALELIGEAQDDRLRRVFCDCTDAHDDSGLTDAVARALGASVAAAADVRRATAQMLRSAGPLLLVVDNVEQIAELMKDSITAWLSASPDLSLLVTSRVRLHHPAERIFEVSPLSLVTSDEGPSEAVQLFMDRATAVRTDFACSALERAVIERIASSLDGLPLALEIAAARARVLGPAQILEDIERLCLGSAGNAPRPPMVAALGASWSRLTVADREALEAASVFRGGFDLAAFARVAMSEPDQERALAVLMSLCDQSLISVHKSPHRAGELRFALLLTVRVYAADSIQADRAQRAKARHTDHYLAFAESMGEQLRTQNAADATIRFEADLANVRAAIDRESASTDPTRVCIALRATLALDELLFHRGPNELRDELFQQVFLAISALEEGTISDELMARAHLGRGRVRQRKGEMQESFRDYEKALQLALAGDLGESEALARTCLGTHLRMRGALDEATQQNELALARLGSTIPPDLGGRILINLGGVHREAGRREAARAAFERGVELFGVAGDLIQLANAQANLGRMVREAGHLEEARVVLKRAEQTFRGHRDVRFRAALLCDLVALEQDQGDFPAADQWIDAAHTALSQVDDRPRLAWLEVQRGMSQFGMAKLALAEESFLRALHLDVGERGTVLGDLTRALLGAVECRRGRLDAAENWLDGLGEGWPDHGTLTHGDLLRALCAQLPVARAPMASEAGERRALLAEAEAVLERGKARLKNERASVCPSPANLAWALRELQVALLAVSSGNTPALPEAAKTPPNGPISIALSGRWFAQEEQRTSFARRPALRNLLAALAAHARQQTPQPLTVQQLLAAGWPGERIRRAAGLQRVYTALSTLRKLGLESVMQRVEDGYRLDGAAIVLVDDLGAPASQPTSVR